jgi:DNA-binding response OmpR family regulator
LNKNGAWIFPSPVFCLASVFSRDIDKIARACYNGKGNARKDGVLYPKKENFTIFSLDFAVKLTKSGYIIRVEKIGVFTRMKILIVDDEEMIRSVLREYVEFEGNEAFEAADGMEAVKLCRENDYDLVLMDVMMPLIDRISAVRALRERGVNLPIIFLSAKSEDTDKILGLELGADDYVTKPFNPVELMARVKSHLRRYTLLGSRVERKDLYRIGTLELDDGAKTVTRDGELIALTPTEYDILKFMIKSPGKVMSLRDIYVGVWGESPYGAEGTVPVHIRHLREKIEYDPSNPTFIKVVWGRGYKIDEKGTLK